MAKRKKLKRALKTAALLGAAGLYIQDLRHLGHSLNIVEVSPFLVVPETDKIEANFSFECFQNPVAG